MQIYETTLVIDSLQKTDEVQATLGKMETFIKNHGGNIRKKEEWGKKRLAYEINRKQYGTYFHILLEGPSDLPGLLSAECKLQESILRHLTVKADKHRRKQLDSESVEQEEKDEVTASEAEPVKAEQQETEPQEPEQPEAEQQEAQQADEQAVVSEKSEASEAPATETAEAPEAPATTETAEAPEAPAKETAEPASNDEPEEVKS